MTEAPTFQTELERTLYEALASITDSYVDWTGLGDCEFRTPEAEDEVLRARAALRAVPTATADAEPLITACVTCGIEFTGEPDQTECDRCAGESAAEFRNAAADARHRSRPRRAARRMTMVADRPLSELFAAIVAFADARGVKNINELPGCWEATADAHGLSIAVNGHSESKDTTDGFSLDPFNAFVKVYGWPAAVVNPFGGVVILGSEDDLIAIIKTATVPDPQP